MFFKNIAQNIASFSKNCDFFYPMQIFHVSHLPGFWPVMNLREVQAFGPRGRERDYDGQG